MSLAAHMNESSRISMIHVNTHRGPQGFVGPNGPDGANGFDGARGNRGAMGAGCDGT